MGALQVLLFVTSAVLVLENGPWKVEGAPRGTYTISTVHQPSSSHKAITPAASQTHYAASPAATYRRSELSASDYRRYLPVEDTPEVKKAREQFFKLYQKQASLAAVAPDNHLDGARDDEGYTDYDYYYDYEEDEDDEDEYEDDEDEEDDDDDDDDDDEEESESDEDEDEYDDDEEDSSSSSSSSSSSEEDYYGYDSSEEYGEDSSSSEESSEDYGGEDSSSSSSSSSSSEEDGEARAYVPLNTNLLAAPQPVTDTPEVKQAKRNFFDLYKAQAELSFNAPDDY